MEESQYRLREYLTGFTTPIYIARRRDEKRETTLKESREIAHEMANKMAQDWVDICLANPNLPD